MLTLSLTLVLFRTRSNLFWHFWMDSSSWIAGSESFHLTLPRSWRPYLIFDVNKLSLIFNRAFRPMWFFNLRIIYFYLLLLWTSNLCKINSWATTIWVDLATQSVHSNYLQLQENEQKGMGNSWDYLFPIVMLQPHLN